MLTMLLTLILQPIRMALMLKFSPKMLWRLQIAKLCVQLIGILLRDLWSATITAFLALILCVGSLILFGRDGFSIVQRIMTSSKKLPNALAIALHHPAIYKSCQSLIRSHGLERSTQNIP